MGFLFKVGDVPTGGSLRVFNPLSETDPKTLGFFNHTGADV